MRRDLVIGVVASGLLFISSATRAIPSPPLARASSGESRGSAAGLHFGEHRYRIVGKMRLLLFWARRDDVGSARMTARADAASSTLTLLVGSDPQRAPRNLNEWSYLREEVRPSGADVFALGNVDRPGGAEKLRDGETDDGLIGVSCVSMQDDGIHSVQTQVNARGLTYWMFDRLLDQIAASPKWREQHMPKPPGAAAGFLTAMQHVMIVARSDPRALTSLSPITYVYNNVVYDLAVRDTNWLGRTRVGARTFDRLVKSEFAVRNHTTHEVSRFGVTFSPEPGGPALPVQIFFQPNFWVRVELQLDETAQVPADPAADNAVLTRIRAICAGASHER